MTLYCIGGLTFRENGALTATESARAALADFLTLTRLAPDVCWSLFAYVSADCIFRLVAEEGRWSLQLPEPQRQALHALAEAPEGGAPATGDAAAQPAPLAIGIV